MFLFLINFRPTKLVLLQLLVGIKDTNDEIVALTLRALAELVPILGSDIVIGGKRAKLFTDGRPVLHSVKNSKQKPIQSQSLLSEQSSVQSLVLPERPQPDGEEVDTSTDEVEPSGDDDLETWEDWDANDRTNLTINGISEPSLSSEAIVATNNIEPDLLQNSTTPSNFKYEVHRKKSLPDIAELDIKNQTNSKQSNDDVDFFQDMEPVIESKPRFTIVTNENNDKLLTEVDDGVKKFSLNVAAVEELVEDGWGEEEWD